MMKKSFYFVISFENNGRFALIAFLFLTLNFSFPLVSAPNALDSSKSILINQDGFTPLEKFRGDTVRYEYGNDIYSGIPGAIGSYTTALQDSNYTRALKIKELVPLSSRITNDLRAFSPLIPHKTNRITFDDQVNNILNLPPEYFMPNKVDVANYQYGLYKSQNNVTGITVYNPFGLKIPLSSIMEFCGLSEDVSPVIRYAIDYRTDVEILVYSLNAVAVATIYDGLQVPGKYTYTWNGRDDAGRKLPKGDYIAEIRIGREKYIRKRIVIK